MKNTLKRLLSLLLVITMVLFMVPAAFAAETTEETAAAVSTEESDIAPAETSAEEIVETSEETAAVTEAPVETTEAAEETMEAVVETTEETTAAVENVTEPAEALLEDTVTDEALDAAAVTGPNMTAAGLKILSKTTTNVASGVSYDKIISRNSSNQQNIGILTKVNLGESVTMKAVYNGYYTAGSTAAERAEASKNLGWSFQYISTMISDYASIADPVGTVVMATNADFFNMTTGEPSGYLIMEGNAIRTKNEPYFAILKDGSAVIRDAGTDCSDVQEAISGPYYLVKNGKNVAPSDPSAVPRNSVGICDDGSVVFYLNDGRQEPTSVGMSLSEMAAVLLDAGCHTALYLDGGGSASVHAREAGTSSMKIVNSPSDGFERNVSSAILIVSTDAATGVFDHAVITPNGKMVSPKATVQFSAAGVDTAGIAVAVPSDVVWALSDNSFGTINSNGLFTANTKTGKVTVELRRGGACVGSAVVEIVASSDACSSAGHELENAVYDRTNGKVICNSCGTAVNAVENDYTDWARDKETGRKMYLITGVPQTGEFLFDKETYYFDENGVAYQGKGVLNDVEVEFDNGQLVGGYTGFLKKSDGNTYHYQNGQMTYGWYFEGEDLYHFNTNTGAMTTGTKVMPDDEAKSKNAYYDFAEDGKVLHGYFNPKGYYYWAGLPKIDSWVKNGADPDPDAWYRTNSHGHFVTGGTTSEVRIYVDGVIYTFENSTGKLLKGGILDNPGGTRSYYWAGEPATNGWVELDGKTYYACQDGTLAMGTHVIDGKSYLFNASGELVTDGMVTVSVLNANQTVMILKVCNADKLEKVRFAVWYEELPQAETLVWYDAVKNQAGDWELIVPLCDYKRAGTLNVHTFATENGKESFLAGAVLKVPNTVDHTYSHQYDEFCDVCGEETRDLVIPTTDQHRMYNPNTGEHLFTGSIEERDMLVAAGWHYEGIGFNFPVVGDPVYRLFDPATGEHLYTMDTKEIERLKASGWTVDAGGLPAFNSEYQKSVEYYRLHNPNATVGAYHFTGSVEERDYLISLGWEYQGIAWYSALN